MPKMHDLKGQRFGLLTASELSGSRNGNALWMCLCDCGATTVVIANNLKRGFTKSCGCHRREVLSSIKATHGEARNKQLSPEYKAYRSAKRRCTIAGYDYYHRYGGRDIRFCFASFTEFLNAVGRKPSPAHELDRIDNNGNYESGNVRWVTHKENCQNRGRK